MEIWTNSVSGRFPPLLLELTELHFFQAEHVHPRSSVPPPFCFLYYITMAIYNLKRKFKSKERRKETMRSNDTKIKYFKLLKTLIQRKQNMDDEMITTEN